MTVIRFKRGSACAIEKQATKGRQRKSSDKSLTSADIERLASGSPDRLFDIDATGITRLTRGSAANGDKNDPIVSTGKSELQLRDLAMRFGFDRIPQTYGEFCGFLDYCVALHAVRGDSMPEDVRATWCEVSLALHEKHRPALMPALRLFCAGDLEALKQLHRSNGTLERLGREFVEFEPDSHGR